MCSEERTEIVNGRFPGIRISTIIIIIIIIIIITGKEYELNYSLVVKSGENECGKCKQDNSGDVTLNE